MVIPDDVLVLDCDPRRFVGGVNQLAELWAKLNLPKPIQTYMVQSGGEYKNVPQKGVHIYFKIPKGFKAKGKVPGYPALDLKGRGGFVCAAGSLHESGKMYMVLRGDISNLMDMPQELMDYVKRDERTPNFGGEPFESDDEQTKHRFITHLMSAEPSGSFKTACVGRDLGLSKVAVFELMYEHWNPRRALPHAPEALKGKVENAFTYAKNPQGCDNPDSDFSAIDPVAAEAGNDRRSHSSISTITASELMQKDFPLPRWAVEPILPEGLTILAGPPKVGKSWLALTLSLAVATGGKALGVYQASQGEVLYLALEDNHRRLKDRMSMLADGNHGIDSGNLKLSCLIQRYDKGGLQELDGWLDGHPGCRLVIIDTLGRFSPAPNARMNAYDNDYRVLAKMQTLAITRQVALVFITHLRKQPSTDSLEQVMGSTGITGAADAIWVLKRGRGEGNGILTVTGRDIEEQELAVMFDKNTCQWTALGDAGKYQLGKERLRIIEYLEKSKEPVGPKDVAAALGYVERNVKGLMWKMHELGQLGKTSRGQYVAIAPTDDFGDFEPKSPSATVFQPGN
jgi:hypothetical protein